MHPDRFAEIERVCQSVLEREPAARERYLEEACAGDADLRAEVESLLAEQSRAGDFLETPAAREAGLARRTAPSAAEPTLPEGTRLGPYEICALVGAGGMGEVYRARDTRLGRTVAVKVLSDGLASDEECLRRFEQEARAASALNHPHICVVHDVGAERPLRPASVAPATTAGLVHFLVMEYLEGETLTARIARGPLPIADVLEYGAQMADALGAAHRGGVVHRDLKPDNVALTASGVKLLDFGVAKLIAQAGGPGRPESPLSSSPATAPGLAWGSVPYMAPEQLEGKVVDARADLFALGAVLYEMTTGQRAFQGGSTASVISSVLTGEPPAVHVGRPDVPPALERLVTRCLEKAPERRCESALELATGLRAIAPSGTSRRRGGSKRRRAAAWSAALVALALITIGVVGLREKRRPPRAEGPVLTSLAVLPLMDRSGDPTMAYVADGMTEALIDELRRYPSLKVISRTSAMSYKNTDKTAPQIAKELDVEGLIEASILRMGTRVRISARLIEARTERQVWADRVEADMSDVLKLYDETAARIARGINLTLAPAQNRAVPRRTVVPAAYEAYLRGRVQLHHFGDSTRAAMRSFDDAIRLDPTYAPAYGSLALGYADAAYQSGEVNDYFSRARTAALRAIELDASQVEAHVALAAVAFANDWDWTRADLAFNRALALDPASVDARTWRSSFLLTVGRFDEAVADSRNALDTDPVSTTAGMQLGYCYMMARRYDEAAAQYERTLELDPGYTFVKILLVWTSLFQGRYPEAEATFAQLPPNRRGRLRALLDASMGRRTDALRFLSETASGSKGPSGDPYYTAWIYAALGSRDEAIRWLMKARDERNPQFTQIKVDPAMDSLRADQRFQEMVRRMNFPQ